MKNKKLLIIGIIIAVIIVIVGVITNYIDTERVTTNQEPKYCIKIISNGGKKVTYWGLGYKIIRYTGVSPYEQYSSNTGAKIGSWFMKYELPEVDNIKAEYEGQTVNITNARDIGTIENILLNSKYTNEICDGIITHKITLNNDVYYIKESCRAIQKGNKQAEITIEDIEKINNVIKSEEHMKLYIKVNNKILTATLENNSSVDALIEKLKQGSIVINMKDYANFEKVGTIEFNLPRNDKQITTEAGDIILYQGNSITIYYDTNSWNFTKLGHIEDITQEELKEILGSGDVTVTLTLNK